MGTLVQELFRVGLYKRSQGRVARQATFVLAIIVSLGAWRLYEQLSLSETSDTLQYLVPLVLLLAGLWTSFRLVQMPTFADFLISVEGEMSKVSWPARGELFRATVVVILVIFLMAFVLFMFDIMWENLRKLLF